MKVGKTISITLPAEKKSLTKVRDFAEKYGEKFGYNMRQVNGFRLSLDEICTNIIQHSYLMSSGEIRGSLTQLTNGIQIDLYDDGESFDPSSVPTPSPQFNTLNEGGYGLHIVRQIMDNVTYQASTPRGNHWRLIKYIPRD